MFHIILFEPEIPPNTGNIIRLSVNTGFELHLIRPLGFSVDDKNLHRAGLDYIKKTDFNVWNNLNDCLNELSPSSTYSVSTKGKTLYTDLKYNLGNPVISTIVRISRPGRRIYSRAESIPKINNGLGISIVSTSKGIMTDSDARRQNVGGEVICKVF